MTTQYAQSFLTELKKKHRCDNAKRAVGDLSVNGAPLGSLTSRCATTTGS